MGTSSYETLTDEQRKVLNSPVFIIGCGRSGTTWLQRLFLEHPDVVGGQESEFFLAHAHFLDSAKFDENEPRRVGLSSYWQNRGKELDSLTRRIWCETFAKLFNSRPSAQLFIEKTPTNVFQIDRINKIFPDAKFIHLIRDSRAVVSSLLAANQGWGQNWAPKTAKESAILWWRSVTVANRAAALFDDRKFIEIHYEDLMDNTEEMLTQIYKFSGLTIETGLVEEIVKKQSFSNQKKLGGTGIHDVDGNIIKEPQGFLRKGKTDSWKTDLNIYQKLVVWRYTRKLMKENGYDWQGRITDIKGQ